MVKHTLNILFSLCVVLLFCSFTPKGRKNNLGIKTVVIDAGHGGHDPGCHGRKGKEKEVTLSVALKLGKMITENNPDVKVIYTRDKDVFVELHERANIANRNHADLFISIHCNSGKSSAYGVETFSMGLHRSSDNLDVAKRENESVLLEKDYKSNYEGFDPSSPEASIIFTLYQNAFLDQSLTMASLVQDEFREGDKRFDRGVKQAGFLVLVYTAMPSILIETGFLSNPEDEKIMVTEKGQQKIAESIYRAFRKYKGEGEEEKNPESIRKEELKSFSQKEKPKEISHTKTSSNPIKAIDSTSKKVIEPIVIKEEIKKEEAVKLVEKQPDNKDVENTIIFKVQLTSSDKKIPLTSTQFKNIDSIWEYTENGLFKYTYGNFSDSNEAIKAQRTMREKGFKEAFVVAFLGNKRLTIKEAILQQKKNN